jgi:hypothetical protein
MFFTESDSGEQVKVHVARMGERGKMLNGLRFGNPQEEERLEELGAGGRIILNRC